MRHAVFSALSLILVSAAPALAAPRLEVLPGTAQVRPGDRIRLTAIAWVGPADKPVATLPPAVEWSTNAGQIDSKGLLLIPSSAPNTITVRASVGNLQGSATLQVRRSDLIVLPGEVRVLAGKALRFTVLDFRGGSAKTPENLVYDAERGIVSSRGRYRAPDTPGPDSITVRLGDRVATAQILVVTSAGSGGPSSGPKPKPSATPSATPAPPSGAGYTGKPWRIKSWHSSGGFGSKNHRIVVEILHPRAARLKAFVHKVGGSGKLASSREVKAGQTTTLSLTLTMTANSSRIVLYDREGKVLASSRHSK
jgi:hypothetical protein